MAWNETINFQDVDTDSSDIRKAYPVLGMIPGATPVAGGITYTTINIVL